MYYLDSGSKNFGGSGQTYRGFVIQGAVSKAVYITNVMTVAIGTTNEPYAGGALSNEPALVFLRRA
jgi:hypothetical protein